MQWSPDGNYLAFMGSIEGSQSSLYLYDSKSQTIKRLSQNQYHAAYPYWSPDGKWIVYEEIENFFGERIRSVWAASIKGDNTKLLYTSSINQKILKWVGEDNFIVADRDMAGERNIRMINVATGAIKDLYSGYYTLVAVSENGTVIFFPTSGAPGAGYGLEEGFYLISPNNTSPRLIHKSNKTENIFSFDLIWNSSIELFISGFKCTNEPEKAIAFDLTGEETCITRSKANFSPNGIWYIVENANIGVYNSNGEKFGEINEDGKYIIWNPSSDGFFIVTSDNELNFTPLPNLNLKNVYKSEKGFNNFVWTGIP